MAAWLDDRLQKSSGAHDLCTPTSPELLEWDALTSFMENVMARLFASTEPKPPVEEGVRLAKAVLYFDTKVGRVYRDDTFPTFTRINTKWIYPLVTRLN